MLKQIDDILKENDRQDFQWKQRLERVFPSHQCVEGEELDNLMAILKYEQAISYLDEFFFELYESLGIYQDEDCQCGNIGD